MPDASLCPKKSNGSITCSKNLYSDRLVRLMTRETFCGHSVDTVTHYCNLNRQPVESLLMSRQITIRQGQIVSASLSDYISLKEGNEL